MSKARPIAKAPPGKVGQVVRVSGDVIKSIFERSVSGPKESSPKLRQENGVVGALFASKAIVQLLVNPVVGHLTSRLGYAKPFFAGTLVLFASSTSEFK